MVRPAYLPLLLVAATSCSYAANLSNVIAGKLSSQEPNEIEHLGRLVSDVVSREMTTCSLAVFYDGLDSVRSLSARTLGQRKGLSFVDLRAVDVRTAMRLKVKVQPNDAVVCRGVLILAGEEKLKAILETGVELWAGDTNTFIVLLPNEESKLADSSEFLLKSSLRFSVHVVLAVQGQTKERWIIYSTRLFTGEDRHSIERIDSWTYKRGFREGRTLFPKNKLMNLQGFNFSVAAIPYSPFVIDKGVVLPGPGRYRGFEITLLDVLAKAINFTYHYVRPADGQWGRLGANGTWTGMIGMVATEKADFAVSDIGISTPREAVVDFTKPFIYDASELFTPLAKPLPQWLGPVRPFTPFVWGAVAVAVATAGPFLTMIARFCAGSAKAKVKWFRYFENATMFTTQPVFQRGNNRDIVEAPGRIFVGFWLLFTMILGIMYSSSLISFLVSPGLQEPIKNLEQLVRSNIKWARVYYGGIQSTILEQATDPVMVALREGVQWRGPLESILVDVAKGTTATWDNSITTRLLIAVKFTDKRGRPRVHMPGFNVHVDKIAWPLLQYAPFKRRFDQLIDRVVEAGLVENWLQSLLFEEQRLVRQRNEEPSTDFGENGTEGGPVILSLEHFQGPFFVYLLGNLAGALVLLLEVLLRVIVTKNKEH